MEDHTVDAPSDREVRPWDPPSFAVIPLGCEITAYAPDDDRPLF